MFTYGDFMKYFKKLKKKIDRKKHINKIKKFINNMDRKMVLKVFLMTLPFILMHIFIIILGREVNYTNYKFMGPILFTIGWLLLFIGSTLSFKKKIGKWIYLFFSILFIVLFFVHGVYFSMTKNFFDFSLMEAASEGAPYIFNALAHCKLIVYFEVVILIITTIIGFINIPENKNNNYKTFGIICVVFLILHILTPFTLGKANKDLTWNSWRNARNIYNSFNDSNKSMKTSGFFEYTFRNFYITFLKTIEQESEEDIEFLDSAYVTKNASKNEFTGLFKDKNLILIQLEGTDKWVFSEKDTPVMYKLMQEGINFDKHYSFYTGGGSTFNSEFVVNTGYTTPFSYTRNAYSFNKNDFPNTLARMFKEKNYSVNAFHMNTGEYYSRTVNYKNWGYDNYYGLSDVDDYKDQSYMLDRELIINEKFNELLFPEEGNFVDYIIAYSGHVPFDNTDGVCKMLYDLDVEEKAKKGENTEFVQMTEEECVRRQARETDYMVELLLKNLKEKKLLDKTAIVIFTDHYLFTIKDQSVLAKYKNTSNNLINHTPWFIWSPNIKNKKVTKVTSQLNILPTVLNLYGFKYNSNNYIGEDALSKKYKGLAFFSDYSWYDGNVYVEGGEIKNGKKMKTDALEEMNEYVNYLTKKNDLTLKYNYFKKQSSE